MAESKVEKDFDWKGDKGDKFAEVNPSTAEGQDMEMSKMFDGTCTGVFKKVLEDLKSNGFENIESAKVIDVGCSSGGKLAVMESLGLKADNLYGVDISPKAIEVTMKNHPDYHAKAIEGFNYKVFDEVQDFDLVYHCAVKCQVPEENYDQFFQGLKSLKPKFYMFMEGISPSGPFKIPNSVIHKHHKGHHKHHHHEHAQSHKGGDSMDSKIEMLDEGFHYVDNMEKLIEKFMPEAKQISRQQIHVRPDHKEMFEALKMEYFLVAAYKI